MTEAAASVTTTPPQGRPLGADSGAVLGQRPSQYPDQEVDAQLRDGAHWTARKVCAHLKIASALMGAIIIHPGADQTEDAIDLATKEMLDQAADLSLAAEALVALPIEHPDRPAFVNLMRQQCIELVAAQWRMSNATGRKPLSVDSVAEIFRKIVHAQGSFDEHVALDAGIADPVIARRVALMAVAPEIYSAVNSFDYYHPRPDELVMRGIEEVAQAAQAGLRRIMGDNQDATVSTVVSQSLIGKAGSLYAANYLAAARKDIGLLQQMDDIERAHKLQASQKTGLPTDHLHQSYRRIMGKVVGMICDAVPEAAVNSEPAPGASPPQAGNEVEHEPY